MCLTLGFIVALILIWLEKTVPSYRRSICQKEDNSRKKFKRKKFKRKHVEQFPTSESGIQAGDRDGVLLMKNITTQMPSNNSTLKRKKVKWKKVNRKSVEQLPTSERGIQAEERDGVLLMEGSSPQLLCNNSTEVLMESVIATGMTCSNTTGMSMEDVKSETEKDGERVKNRNLESIIGCDEENTGEVAQAENNFQQLQLQGDLQTNPGKSPGELIRDPRNSFWQESKQFRQNPCSSSVQLFDELSSVSRNISLCCEKCLAVDEGHPEHWVHLTQLEHDCGKDRLLICNKSDELEYFIRFRPLCYSPSENNSPLCSGRCVLSSRDCSSGPACLLPHSLEEKWLWEKDFKMSKVSSQNLSFIQQFIHDLDKSSLRTKYLVRHMSEKFSVDFKLLCRTCFERDGGHEQVRKARHVPKCVNGHSWNENNVLVLERSKGTVEVLGTVENISKENHGEEMVGFLCSLKESGMTCEEIAEEGRRHRQRIRSNLKGPHLDKVKIFDSLYSCSSLNACFFDEDVDDVLDPNAFSEDTGDLVHGSDEGKKQNPYYNLSRGSALVEKGTIHLHRIDFATCTIEDGDRSYVVEINGRANCGPTFDGDVVEVELMETNKSDASSTKKGTVVTILKRNTHRTARTFVCMVDRYRGNLMTPICGTLPRFHVLDKDNERQYGRKNKFHYITVYSTESGKLTQTGTIHLQEALRANMLFVVKYLKWTESFPYPLGYVCKAIKSGTDRKSSRTVLNLIHEIPTRATQSSELLDTEFVDIQGNEIDLRKDLTSELTISIDHKYTVCIDDAFTVKKCPSSGSFDVWVHITDVSFTIHKDSEWDKIAESRMQSVYYKEPGMKPSHLFPDKLATNHLSLVQNKRRRTISVHFKFDSNCELVGNPPEVIRSIVTNDKKLSYEKAQKIIKLLRKVNLDTLRNEVEKSVLYLHHIAKKLRAGRMRNAQHYYDHKIGYKLSRSGVGDPFSCAGCHDSQWLVEEFMILTNTAIAKFLVDKLSVNEKQLESLPLLQQKEPAASKQSDWKRRHGDMDKMSFFFDQFEGLHRMGTPGTPLSHLWMLDSAWKALMNALKSHDAKKICMIVGSEHLHPFHSLALKDWFDIQEPSEYVCAGPDPQHYRLHVTHYVQFTAPIRRYMDIVIHRLVNAALDNAAALPYSTEELQDICRKVNLRRKDLKSEKAAWSLVKIADMLSTPHFLPCVVHSLTSSGILLEVPHFLQRKCSTSSTKGEVKFHFVRYSNLMVHGFHSPAKLNTDVLCAGQSPSVNDKSVNVMWKKKYFDTRRSRTVNARTKVRKRRDSDPEFMLSVAQYGKRIDAHTWKNIQNVIIAEESDSELVRKMKDTTRHLSENKEFPNTEDSEKSKFVSEVTSEMGCVKMEALPLVNKNVYFSLTLLPGSILPVQFGKATVNGFLQPEIRLIHLANGKDICLEHHCKPLKCFPVSTGKAIRQTKYISVEQYIETWSPILELQAVSNATNDASSILCNHVPTTFEQNGSSYSGFFKLSEEFCRKRQLHISKQLAENEMNDYLCIRCETSKALLKNFVRSMWVCHAVTVGAELDNGDVVLWFKLCPYSTEPPDQILRRKQNYCTVEFLHRIMPDRRMAKALYGLRNASRLCREIVLGENCFNRTFIQYTRTRSDNGQVQTEPQDSECQRTAMQAAISQPFTLIQGPPGTGKTCIGVKIANEFVKKNLLNCDEDYKQVLFCGPSNSSVDAAAKQFRTQLGSNCPRLVRVYSKKKENLDFPIPRDLDELDEQLDIKGDDEISLHHIIRRTNKPYNRRILEYDQKFSSNMHVPETISDSEISAYQKLIKEASAEELKNYDIILCTCSTSASDRLTHGVHIMQIIIDECAMCMEAESLIPLVNFQKAEKVVLIGDHKQLQPIIKNAEAKRLGLDVSLFERHADNVHVMLDLQYRMHNAISEFPSLQFYNSKLRTDDKIMELRCREVMDAIWPNKKYPMVFCHVEGTERTQTVTTHEANEESRSNEEERRHVIRIAETLTKKLGEKRSFGNHSVEEKEKIAILSQYKAQCSALKKDLKKNNRNCLVSTVVASQGGEWDYVILSTVRSLPKHSIEKNPTEGWCFRNMGFICDTHQINVALTRARMGLIIVGNKDLLQCHSMWGNLLTHYRERGCLVNAEDFPRSVC